MIDTCKRIQARVLGFTLMEMVIAITLVGVVAGLSWPMLAVSVKSYMISEDLHAVQMEGSIGMGRISNDLQNAIQGTLVIAPATEITFSTSDYIVRYHLLDGNLMINVDGTDAVLADDISNLQFEYDTADPNTLTYIRFSFDAVHGDAELPLRTTIYMR